MTKTTRRGAIAAMAAIATVAVVPASISNAPRRVSVQSIIADIRALPSSPPHSTQHKVKRVLETTADLIEEFGGKGIGRPRADIERLGGAS